MEKILIKENVISQNAAIADTKSFCKNVNRILPEFKEETGYSLNIDELRIIFFDKNNLSVLIEKVNDATVNNFSAIELPPILKRTLLSDCAKTVNKFAMRLQILSNQSGANHLQNYLTLKNEELTLSSDDEQKIRDEFRIFVTSEEAKEFYEKHREISQRLSEFATYVSDKTGRSFGIDGLAKYYFVNGTNPCEILPFPTDYEKAIQKEWQKFLPGKSKSDVIIKETITMKGKTNNPNGRPKGKPNKATTDLRTWINKFIDDNRKQIKEDWLKLDPKDRMIMFEKLLKYTLPTLQATTLTTDFDKLTDEQLDVVVKELLIKLN